MPRKFHRAALAVGLVIRSAGDVIADRGELAIVAGYAAADALEEQYLQLFELDDAQVRVRLHQAVGEVAAQKWKLEVRRDAGQLRDAELHELLDRSIRNDYPDALQRMAPLPRADRGGERRDQIFQSISVVQPNHRSPTVSILHRWREVR